MSKLQQKPILHGRDHRPGGVDPIPGMGGGIQFDTYPQAGQWLYLETDGAASSPGGFGIEIYDFSGNGIHIDADDATLHLNEYGDQQARMEAVDDVVIGAGQRLLMAGTEGVNIHANESGAFFGTQASAGHTQGPAVLGYHTGSGGVGTDGMFLHLESLTAILHIQASSDPLDASTDQGLKVLWNGVNWEYHIATGATWVADL